MSRIGTTGWDFRFETPLPEHVCVQVRNINGGNWDVLTPVVSMEEAEYVIQNMPTVLDCSNLDFKIVTRPSGDVLFGENQSKVLTLWYDRHNISLGPYRLLIGCEDVKHQFKLKVIDRDNLFFTIPLGYAPQLSDKATLDEFVTRLSNQITPDNLWRLTDVLIRELDYIVNG